MLQNQQTRKKSNIKHKTKIIQNINRLPGSKTKQET